jgi:uncharacterized protein
MSSASAVKDGGIAAPPEPSAVKVQAVSQAAEWANPAVIGLMGFATTTIATGAANSFGTGIGAAVALAIAFGGGAQFVAGWVDLRKNNIFGGTAFVGYGAFWWAFVLLVWALPSMGVTVPKDAEFVFFLCWTLFTLSLSLAVFKINWSLTAIIWFLLLAYILLDFVVLGWFPANVAGYEIILTGLIAWYVATGTIVNAVHGKKVLPLP